MKDNDGFWIGLATLVLAAFVGMFVWQTAKAFMEVDRRLDRTEAWINRSDR